MTHSPKTELTRGVNFVHVLKTDPEVFDAVKAGKKNFEIRADNRAFKVGDILKLRRTESTGEQMLAGAPLEYSGPSVDVVVTYILRGPIYGLAAGWVIMSIKEVTSG